MLKQIFVGCMPFGFNEENLRHEFAPFGSVRSISLFEDRENATFDSYAHVSIETDDVEQLLAALDGKVFGDRLLRVNERVTREDTLRRRECETPTT